MTDAGFWVLFGYVLIGGSAGVLISRRIVGGDDSEAAIFRGVVAVLVAASWPVIAGFAALFGAFWVLGRVIGGIE